MTPPLDIWWTATVQSGLLPLLPIALPLVGLVAAVVVGGRAGAVLALLAHAASVVAIALLVVAVIEAPEPLVVMLGDWAPPLGIALRADILSAAMLAVSAAVLSVVAAQATATLWPPRRGETRMSQAFWPLLLAVSASLATVVLAGDLFTLHIAIELLTFAAVPLLCLDGRTGTLQAALRYLLFALLGSMLYLSGLVLLYGLHGTLDIGLLAAAVRPDWPTLSAAALMTTGLMAKTALVPLHFWLPPAHAGAPAVVSALLSALVVKGGFIVLMRVWFWVMPHLASEAFVALMGGLGLAGIVLGSLVALRQTRLKPLIAYSTVAQIGYLFVLFPIGFDAAAGRLVTGTALTATTFQIVNHALAKAALFLAAGLIVQRAGTDDMVSVRGMGRRMPLVSLTVALALLALAGFPPGGGWAAKTLGAASGGGAWGQALTVAGGLTAAYLAAALFGLLRTPLAAIPAGRSWQGWGALMLAALAMVSGFLPVVPMAGPYPVAQPEAVSAAFVEAAGPLLAGVAVAAFFGQAGAAGRPAGRLGRGFDAVRRGCARLIAPAGWVDMRLGRWSATSVALLALLAACLWTLTAGLR